MSKCGICGVETQTETPAHPTFNFNGWCAACRAAQGHKGARSLMCSYVVSLPKRVGSKLARLNGWTDYPFEQLGDTPHEPAPMRRAVATSYDSDLYVEVVVEGVLQQIKACYFYKSPALHPNRHERVKRTFKQKCLLRLPRTIY